MKHLPQGRGCTVTGCSATQQLSTQLRRKSVISETPVKTKTFVSTTHSKTSSWIGVESAESSDEQSHRAVAFIL
jgi:hypothetical protein